MFGIDIQLIFMPTFDSFLNYLFRFKVKRQLDRIFGIRLDGTKLFTYTRSNFYINYTQRLFVTKSKEKLRCVNALFQNKISICTQHTQHSIK